MTGTYSKGSAGDRKKERRKRQRGRHDVTGTDDE
jgi:hypothetical protein